MPRRPAPSRLPRPLPILAGALGYAALHLLFTALPHTLTFGERYYLDLRPGIVVPLAAGLLAGPWAGALVGLLGRLGGDLLAGHGLDGPGLVYSALLGLIAGLGRRPRANYRALRPFAAAMLWVVLAAVLAAVAVVLGLQAAVLAQHEWPAAWAVAQSETLSGLVAGLLLMPGVLYAAARPR